MKDIEDLLEQYEAKDRERQEREAEIMRLDLQLFAYARNHDTPDDDYHRTYVQRNEMIWDYGKTYGKEAREHLREMLDDAREKFLARAQELEEAAGIGDRERQELEARIKDYDMTLFAISKGENEPDKGERFRVAYLKRCELLKQYREKYGKEAEDQLRDQLEEARKAYEAQYEAERNREKLEKQLHLYRGALRYYRDQLNEATDKADILSYALEIFTERHPEYADEIEGLIEHSTNILEDDEE